MKRGILILGIIAILSVALNLFLAGNQLGHHFRGAPPPPSFDQRLHNIWRDMPVADQQLAQSILDRHYNDIMDKWRAIRPANQRVVTAMRASPFDPDEAKAAYDNASQRWEEYRAATREMLIEIGEKISPEGRRHIRGPGSG